MVKDTAHIKIMSYLCAHIIKNNMAQNRNVIHVEFREPIDGKIHYYFGSKAAIYQRFTSEQIGITYHSLRDVGSIKDKPYINKRCTIWQGELIASQGKQKEE